LSAFVALLFALSATGEAKRTTPETVRPPKLAVIVSIDGLSWDRLEQYRPWYVAGLKRLLDEGLVESACRYRHLNTETGPGHSSLSTGAPPSVSGIVANGWFEQNPDGSIRSVYCADQPAPEPVPGNPPMFYREVAKDGRLYVFAQAAELARWQQSGETGKSTVRLGDGPNSESVVFDSDDAITLYDFRYGRAKEVFRRKDVIPGPGNLRIPTLGDRLGTERPGARTVSISGKNRSAILLAGRDPRHSVYWYDQDTGRFVSSAAYDPPASAKAIVATYNKARAGAMLPARYGLLWRKLPAPDSPAALPVPRPTPIPNLLDYQIPSNGLGFDHDLGLNPKGYFASLYITPFTDELVTELALAFVRDEAFGLGRGSPPDLLELSFSAQDVVSHSYGNESEENLDVLRRLDLQLGQLLAALEQAYPKGSVVLALSSDHGFSPIPEAAHARDKAFTGGRLINTDRTSPNFVERLNRLLDDALCLEPGSRPIFGGEGWNLIYNRPALPMRTIAGDCGAAGALVTTATIDTALPGVLAGFYKEEIAEVLLVSQHDHWPVDDPAVPFARNDLDLERSGDAFLIPRPGVLMHWDPARGSGHGSHHDYDTHVPLLFWGGGIAARRSDEETAPYDLAPTLADMLGIALPEATGKNRIP
jgi:predicted AlkP superfamily pyrophosphatase or phosphodiesterase